MKKIFTIFCVVLLTCVVVLGLILTLSSPSVDFRGKVISIEEKDGLTIFLLEGIEATRYFVRADARTKVEYCHKEDGKISLEEIEIGNIIDGNYRFFSKKDEVAKNIKVQFDS